jgi:alpha-tubulin suppressor-like RCC1 family protein
MVASSPVQVGTGANNWSAVSTSKFSGGDPPHVLATTTNGRLWGWGGNSLGKLGIGSSGLFCEFPVRINPASFPETWSQVFAGKAHSIAIKTNNTLWGWGRNDHGQLGLSDTIARSSPVQIGTFTDWLTVSCGTHHTIGIRSYGVTSSGSLWAWGANPDGQLGLGQNFSYKVSAPTRIGTDTDWAKVSCNILVGTILGSEAPPALDGSSNFAVKTNGTLWAWGRNNYGQLGLNDTTDRSSPVQVGTGATGPWSDVSTSKRHTLGLKTDGTLWAWGSNSRGELGLGFQKRTDWSAPVQVGFGATGPWQTASKSNSVTNRVLAIRSNGTLWGWGEGILHPYTLSGYSPIQIGSDTDWKTVSTSNSHHLAIKTNGTLWAWGANSSGQLGLADTTNRSIPIQIGTGATGDWKTAQSGYRFSIALKENGTLWAWGENFQGQLGLGNGGSSTNRSSPVQIGTGITGDWASVSCGRTHVVAIKTNGTLWAWGYNGNGRLGLGDTTSRSSPVQIGTGTTGDWSNVNCNIANHVLAVKNNGTLWAWGENTRGQLGLNDTTDRSSPVQVGTTTNWSLTGSHLNAGSEISGAIKNDGTLWTWGRNHVGQLGLGDSGVTTYRSSPVQVGGLTGWNLVDMDTQHGLAIRENGTLWTWGRNLSDVLGFASVDKYSSPVQIGSDNNWIVIKAGFGVNGGMSFALKSNGTLWAWGDNYNGQLGLGFVPAFGVHVSKPTQVGTDNTWKMIWGEPFEIASKTDGTLWAWGRNTQQELNSRTIPSLGIGSFTNFVSSPVQIGQDVDWNRVGVGGNHVIALKNDGTIWSWGNRSNGRGAIEYIKYVTTPTQIGRRINRTYGKLGVPLGCNNSFAIR